MTTYLVPDTREPKSLWRTLRRRLWPRDHRFYDLFDRHAELCVAGLDALTRLLGDASDPTGRVREIEAIEKRADGVVADVRATLERALFPPFGRLIVLELINRLDDVLDLTEDAAQSLLLYHITRVTPDAQKLAELALDCATRLQTAVGSLRGLQRPRAVLALCREVDQLEAQADHVMRSAMSKLFREEPDARELVKHKAIYELLEGLTDKCKDAANDIEAIVLRHG
jgi:hypothetical protein